MIDPDSEPSAQELPVTSFVERGSLRIETPQAIEDPLLVLVSSDLGAPRLVERRPDYVAEGLLEFYGQTAGVRHGFVRSRQLVSELFEVVVERGRMAVVRVDQLLPARTRPLELRRDGCLVGTKATVLLQYGPFEVLHDWTGTPIALATPLAMPQGVTVAAARRDDGTLELGLSRRVEGDGQPIVIELDHGDARVALAAATATDDDGGSLEDDQFRFALTPGTDNAAGRAYAVSHLLACVREDEFSIPPHIHTWSSARESERAPAICGLGAGRFRVAAGIERQGRYTLWRPREVRADESIELHVAALEADTQPRLSGAALLPPWMRTFPTPAIDGAALTSVRERQLHPHGPSEIWEQAAGPAFTLRWRAGWRNGNDRSLRLHESDLVLALPDGAAAHVRELRLRITPGLEPQLGCAWDYRATDAAGCAGPFPHAPDGELDGALVLDDGETWTCAGTREDGSWKSGPPRWHRFGDVEMVEALAERDEGAAVAASFSRSVEADPWTWEQLNDALGLDLTALDLQTLGLVGQPSGEIVRLAREAASFRLPRGDVIEVQGQDAGRSLWGVLAATPAVGAQSRLRARIAILNRAGQRTLHVSLPNAELRLTLEPGVMHELVVAAPVRVYLLSLVSAERGPEKAAEEGLGVELRPDDVLVAEYD